MLQQKGTSSDEEEDEDEDDDEEEDDEEEEDPTPLSTRCDASSWSCSSGSGKPSDERREEGTSSCKDEKTGVWTPGSGTSASSTCAPPLESLPRCRRPKEGPSCCMDGEEGRTRACVWSGEVRRLFWIGRKKK